MFRISTIAALIALVIAPVASAGAREDLEGLQALLDDVRIMPGRQHRSIAVFPLVLDPAVKTERLGLISLREAAGAGRVRFAEPEKPARRWNVQVTSRAAQPVLVPGGTLLVGGRLDRMVPEDVVIEPGRTQLETLPAEYSRDERRGPDVSPELAVSGHIAPYLLRENAVFAPRLDLVPSFVARFLDFRAPGDDRNSLEAVAASPDLARRVDADVRTLTRLSSVYEGRVIGWITVIGGRVHGLDLFGSNRLAADHLAPVLRAHAYSLAALELLADDRERARNEGMALQDPERFRPEVEEFFERVKGPDWRLYGDGEMRLRKHRSRGLAQAREGRLVHLSVAADLSFLSRLHDRALPTPPERTPHPAFGPMAREGSVPGRRNSRFEERLLERMEERR